MKTHSSILAWRIPWTEKPGRLQSMGSQELDTTNTHTHTHTHTHTQEICRKDKLTKRKWRVSARG